MKSQLEAVGYSVSVLSFDFPFFQENSPSELEQVSPTSIVYVNGTDFLTMEYSGSGGVTAPLQDVDLVLPLGHVASTSGCEAADYEPFIVVGIPAGRLFTGAEEIKRADQVPLYGGTADVAYDPCIRLATPLPTTTIRRLTR